MSSMLERRNDIFPIVVLRTDMLKELFDSKGKLMMTKKVSDIKTLFELLEGSYLSMDGENLLNDIRLFSTKNLSDVDTSFITSNKEYLSNSLNYFPLAWRSRWYDVRRHITMFSEQGNNTNPVLLNLAKLNFNIIQATHLKDLKDVIRYVLIVVYSSSQLFHRI